MTQRHEKSGVGMALIGETSALADPVMVGDVLAPPEERSLADTPSVALSTLIQEALGNPTPKVHLRRRVLTLDAVALAGIWLPEILRRGDGDIRRQLASALVVVGVSILAMRALKLYRARICAVRSTEVGGVLLATAVGAMTAAVLPPAAVPVLSALVAGLVAAAAVLSLRLCFGRWLKERRSAGDFLRSVVLVGTNDDALELWTILDSEPELGYRVVAVAGEERSGAPWAHLPLDDIENVGALAALTGADGVLMIGSALGGTAQKVIRLALAARLHVQLWPGLSGAAGGRFRLTTTSGVPMLYVEPRLVSRSQARAKRTIDVGLGLLLVVLTAPLMLVIALAVRFIDGGPVLYRSERVGRYGDLITVLKFRTMVQGSATMTDKLATLNERTDGPLFKLTSDPRTTRTGGFLRSASLDELPQLWNVVRGDMSLVGPRPALPAEVARFDEELNLRHQMRPGITGLWQIEARDNPSFHAYRRLDLAYVERWSLGLDVVILGTTVHAVLVRALRLLR